MDSFDYDVLIVGAGPAGCLAAVNLNRDLRVLLIDRSALPRNKSCAGMLKPGAFAILKKYGTVEPVLSSPRVLTPRAVELISDREYVALYRYYNADRKKLDEWLLNLAKENSNVDVMGETRLVGFSEDEDGVRARISGRDNESVIKVRFLVGADGAASGIARQIRSAPIRALTSLQETFEAQSCGDLQEFIGFFGDDIPCYHWLLPKADGYIQIGAGFLPGEKDVKEKFLDFKEAACARFGIRPLTESAIKGHPITLLSSVSEIFPGRGRVLLAGEAAGLIDPSILEGITYALSSGELVAAAINRAQTDPLPLYKASLRSIERGIVKQLQRTRILHSRILRTAMAALAPGIRKERRSETVTVVG